MKWARIATLDLRSLALLRMILGLLILADLAYRLPDAEIFYSDDGVFPRLAQLQCNPATFGEVYMAISSVWGVWAMFALNAAVATALLLGYQTRWAAVLCWFLHGALRHRNHFINDGGVQILNLVLFWSIFLPIGARWSVDSRKHSHWSALPCEYASLATFGYLFQFAVLYFLSAINKYDPQWTRTGEAVYYALSVEILTGRFGRFLTGYPDLLHYVTFVVLGMEYAIPFLLLSPWWTERTRTLGILFIWALHLGISCVFCMGLMQPTFLGVCVGLLPGSTLSWIERRLAPLRGLAREVLNRATGILRVAPCTGCDAPPPGYRLSRLTRFFLASVCLYIVIINYATCLLTIDFKRELPVPVKLLGYVTQQVQAWPFFAPRPSEDDGWFVLEGTCRNGKSVDLLRSQPVSWIKPELVSAEFPSQHWRLWLVNQHTHSHIYPALGQYFLNWAAHRWNLKHSGEESVYHVRLFFIENKAVPAGEERVQKTVLDCERSVEAQDAQPSAPPPDP